ncbi:MAG: preprotein translocase subunit YajC [Candidatus Omnitrophica bacterium]|nr:preprotein translocase subunit YajC [Candidatus Omnitrophota bacterium]
MNLVPLVLIFVIFYFMLIRPQKKQQHEHKKMLEGIAKNDEIVTSGGIHGTVINVKDKTVIVRIDENVKMEIEKSSVAYIKRPQVQAGS